MSKHEYSDDDNMLSVYYRHQKTIIYYLEESGASHCSFMHLSKIILNFMGEHSVDTVLKMAAKVSAVILGFWSRRLF